MTDKLSIVKKQIRSNLEHFEGPVERSKVRSYMNWWVKCISAVVAKTACRNVAFKAWKLRDSIMEGQDSFIMREFEDAEVYFGEDGGDVIVDVGNNADLYAANQESTDLINETYMYMDGEVVASVRFLDALHGSRRFSPAAA